MGVMVCPPGLARNSQWSRQADETGTRLSSSGSPRSGRREVSRDEPLADPGSPERSFSRRTLIKAGWTVPVIIATVSLPTPAYAGSAPPAGPTPPGPTPPVRLPRGFRLRFPTTPCFPRCCPKRSRLACRPRPRPCRARRGRPERACWPTPASTPVASREVGLGLLAAGAAATVVGRQRADTDERVEEDFED